MKDLRAGFEKFRSEKFAEMASHFAALADGQSPEVLMITCSDSRIDPGLICQSKPGEIFVIRNAGNIVPASGSGSGGEVATVEYAVKALKIPHIIVCGHSKCGAMGAVLDPASASSVGVTAPAPSRIPAPTDFIGPEPAGAPAPACLRAPAPALITGVLAPAAHSAGVQAPTGSIVLHLRQQRTRYGSRW